MPQVSFYFKFLQNKIKFIATGHYSIACQRNNEQCIRTPAAYLTGSVCTAFLLYQDLDRPFSQRRCFNLQLGVSRRTHESELSIKRLSVRTRAVINILIIVLAENLKAHQGGYINSL